MSRSTYWLFLAATFLVFTICFRASGWHTLLWGSDAASVTIKNLKLVDLQLGKIKSFEVTLRNETSTALSIVGKQPCCGMTFDPLPTKVDAFSAVPIHARVFVPQKQKEIRWEAVVYVNNGTLVPIGFVVIGSAKEGRLNTTNMNDLGDSVLIKPES